MIRDWVENGKVPEKIIASKNIRGNLMTRPVYPYPQEVVYDGTGDPNSESSFLLK